MKAALRDAMARLLNSLAKSSAAAWVMLAFVATYVLFFIPEVFLNADHAMHFPRYLPYTEPIGMDLNWTLDSARAWLAGANPYAAGNFFAPLVWPLMAPLTAPPPEVAFAIMTGITLAAFLVLTWVIPTKLSQGSASNPVLLLILATGLTSYGLQFEVERGQFNVIAMTLCILGAWLFHVRPRLRWLAYAMFTISVQLKLFPALFVLLFVERGRHWRVNLQRILVLGLANAGLLLILGPEIFREFLQALVQGAGMGQTWNGNHSIQSFVKIVVHALGLPPATVALGGLLLVLVIGLLAFIALRALGPQPEIGSGPQAHLLLACSLVALLVPSISNDYKLSILAGPVSVLLCREVLTEHEGGRERLLHRLLVLLFSLAYFSTLYGAYYKPPFLKNNFPALLVMLLVTAALSAGAGKAAAAQAQTSS